MHYFIFGYVETALVDSLPLEVNDPAILIADYDPSTGDTAPAVDGAIFWNDLDVANGNSIVYDPQKFCIINNVDAADPCTVTFLTPGSEEKGIAKTYADFAVVVAAGKTAITPRFSTLFKDGTLIKMTVTGDGAAATKIAVLKQA